MTWPEGFHSPRVALPGVITIQGPNARSATAAERQRPLDQLSAHLIHCTELDPFPLIVVVDDSMFASQTLNNLLWVAFTRSNPALDIRGVGEVTENKHWGCRGPLIIDARMKPHHAPPLIEDPLVSKRVEMLCARGGPLAGILK